MSGAVPQPGLAETRASRSAFAPVGVALLTAAPNAHSERVDIAGTAVAVKLTVRYVLK
jgi:hypothetical protein